jgi:hypothetical protein
MTDRGMGFRHSVDPNDALFPMRLRLGAFQMDYFPQGLPPGTRHYRTGVTLNQGSTGTCTAHCATHRAHGAPIMQPLPVSETTQQLLTPYDLYRLIVSIDEYSDNDTEVNLPDKDLQMGSSVRAAAKALQKLGLLRNYLHAGNIEEIRAWHLAGFGGLMLGTSWFSDMMETDHEGFVNVSGALDGGHAYASHGWNDRVKHKGRYVRALRCQNSWGTSFGENGFFWIEEDDLGKLFPDGEFIAPVEQRIEALKKAA